MRSARSRVRQDPDDDAADDRRFHCTEEGDPMTTTSMVNNEKIPNNVNLSSDKRLQRALEQWQPEFINWWKEMGPEGYQTKDVYLRTAVSVDVDGWAIFDHVKM